MRILFWIAALPVLLMLQAPAIAEPQQAEFELKLNRKDDAWPEFKVELAYKPNQSTAKGVVDAILRLADGRDAFFESVARGKKLWEGWQLERLASVEKELFTPGAAKAVKECRDEAPSPEEPSSTILAAEITEEKKDGDAVWVYVSQTTKIESHDAKGKVTKTREKVAKLRYRCIKEGGVWVVDAIERPKYEKPQEWESDGSTFVVYALDDFPNLAKRPGKVPTLAPKRGTAREAAAYLVEEVVPAFNVLEMSGRIAVSLGLREQLLPWLSKAFVKRYDERESNLSPYRNYGTTTFEESRDEPEANGAKRALVVFTRKSPREVRIGVRVELDGEKWRVVEAGELSGDKLNLRKYLYYLP